MKEDLKGGGRRRQERASACTMGGVDAFPPCEVESIEGLLKEAEDIKKCATLVSSLGQQVKLLDRIYAYMHKHTSRELFDVIFFLLITLVVLFSGGLVHMHKHTQ